MIEKEDGGLGYCKDCVKSMNKVNESATSMLDKMKLIIKLADDLDCYCSIEDGRVVVRVPRIQAPDRG